MSVIQVACGHGHTIALTDGEIVFFLVLHVLSSQHFSFSNSVSVLESSVLYGSKKKKPQNINYENRGLTVSLFGISDSRLYCWGDNQCGQLGLGSINKKYEDTPRHLKCMTGLAVAQIACGDSHSFVLTVSGALYGWGRNR